MSPDSFSHENEQILRDTADLLVDLRFECICSASVSLPGQALSTRSHRHNRGGKTRLDAEPISQIEMSSLINGPIAAFVAAIAPTGVPALRVAFTIAVLVFLYAGVLIFRRRHQYFDRDPNVENDVPAVRHIRLEQILFVWGALTLVLLTILYQVWRA